MNKSQYPLNDLEKSLKKVVIVAIFFVSLMALSFTLFILSANRLNYELDSISEYVSKNKEQVSIPQIEEAWSQAVAADGIVGLKVIDTVARFVVRSFNLSYEVAKETIAEHFMFVGDSGFLGTAEFKVKECADILNRNLVTQNGYVCGSLIDSFKESEHSKLDKETELSKERTDLRNFEYKILGATKSENKEHLLYLEHYIFLRALDLEEQINYKIIILEEYSKDRNEKLDIFFNPSRYSVEKQQSLQIQKPDSYYGMLIKDIDKQNEIIKDMQENIFKAIQIIQHLEDRISMQEKYEELEEILSN